MRKLALLFIAIQLIYFQGFSQVENYNLDSENLHKKVRKTIDHFYNYDTKSGGFVKRSVSIKRYNDEGNLVETYYLYNGSYAKATPVKTLYNYNSKKQLISTKDISDIKSKYSSYKQFIYDQNGNLTKQETVYEDGSKSYINFQYDNKNRNTRKENYSSTGKLNSETSISYNGKDYTEVLTSYSTKDGSVIGNYTTEYKNDLKTTYKANSKYSDSNTTYDYDNNNNIKKTVNTGKTTFTTTYDYEYDNKDNWVKKHNRSGKYQYFYFREIILDNGKTTGSVNFDRDFINLHGNFNNVAVVPLVMDVIKEENKSTPFIVGKPHSFEYALIADVLYNLKGDFILTSANGSTTLKKDDLAFLTVTLKDKDYKYNFNLTKFTELNDKYEWVFNNTNGNKAIYWQYKKETSLKDNKTGIVVKTNSALSIYEVDQPDMSMYFK